LSRKKVVEDARSVAAAPSSVCVLRRLRVAPTCVGIRGGAVPVASILVVSAQRVAVVSSLSFVGVALVGVGALARKVTFLTTVVTRTRSVSTRSATASASIRIGTFSSDMAWLVALEAIAVAWADAGDVHVSIVTLHVAVLVVVVELEASHWFSDSTTPLAACTVGRRSVAAAHSASVVPTTVVVARLILRCPCVRRLSSIFILHEVSAHATTSLAAAVALALLLRFILDVPSLLAAVATNPLLHLHASVHSSAVAVHTATRVPVVLCLTITFLVKLHGHVSTRRSLRCLLHDFNLSPGRALASELPLVVLAAPVIFEPVDQILDGH